MKAVRYSNLKFEGSNNFFLCLHFQWILTGETSNQLVDFMLQQTKKIEKIVRNQIIIE